MKRKYLYPLLVILFTLGYLFFEEYAHKQLDQPVIEEGTRTKAATNTYFLPTSTTGQVVHHDYYSLSYSETHEQPEWVAYELKKNQVVNADFERPYFEMDLAVATKSAHWRNYKNSGYDRGHLCPAADREFSKSAYNETFLTSNISPQLHEFNAGIWNRLEQQVRQWALYYDGVFVITGGVLEDPQDVIGTEQVSVPRYFYKIIYDQSYDTPKVAAFLMPHREENGPLSSYQVTVDRIEALTSIDFFPALDDTLEARLESTKVTKAWDFNASL